MGSTSEAISLTRRDFLRLTAVGAATLGISDLRVPTILSPLRVAESTGAWIRSLGRETTTGLTWPMAPGHFDDPVLNLYSGVPGVVLFLLELHYATGREEYLREAEAGAGHLMAAYLRETSGASPDEKAGARAGAETPGAALADPGLYTGMAGAAFTLAEVYLAGGDDRFREGAYTLVDRIVATAKSVDSGLLWYSESPEQASYDVVSGSAGIGLTLLYAHERLAHPHALDAAVRVGSVLETRGRPESDGLKWPMSEAYPRLMPNFSHGTAGVVYFLVRLSEVAERSDFLDEAVRGARYLQAASRCGREGCLLFHHEPEGEDLFYLSWCHGPVGTARAFHELAVVTGEDEWRDWVQRGANAIRDLGVPENRTPGYWNNVSQCCGDAGVGDFFLSLHALDPGVGHDRFTWRLAEYLVAQGIEDGDGSRWVQAEHRTRPDYVMAQTGWMQGASGVGAFFLHLDGMEKNRSARVVFPDSPWRGAI